jgi:hypothetical protein
VASPLALRQPAAAAFSALSVGDVAAAPSLALRDAAFALLARESLRAPVEPSADLTPRGGLVARLADGVAPVNPTTPLSPQGGYGLLAARGVVNLLDGAWTDDQSGSSSVAWDDAPPEA